MMPKSKSANELASQEALLLDYIRQLGRHPAGRRIVHIHLSKLKAHHRREHHLRIAASSFETLVRLHDGQLFSLANADFVFICQEASAELLDSTIQKLRLLFSEDPLSHVDDTGPASFCTWYDVATEYDACMTMAEEAAAEAQHGRAAARGGVAEHAAEPIEPMDAGLLSRVQDALGSADLSNVIRRQAACAIAPGAAPKPVFRELYVSIPDLQRAIAPKLSLSANRWLFQHLTETLDKRVLATLPKYNDSSVASHFSLNLNVSTLLSPEFLAFDSVLKSNARGTVVIELQPIDIFADMSAFQFAREFVRERGYRLCLDGITHLTAELIDRERLGLDLMKIVWSPDMLDDPADKRRPRLKQTIDQWGLARVIMCRCDCPDAVSFGHSIGIQVFQGRHIDALLTASQKPSLTLRQATAGA